MKMLATPKTLNPADPEHLDFLHRKLLYALDERPVFWWKQGTKYGVINGEAKPMWGMWVFFVQRVVEHRQDSFDVASLEAVYMTDLETGELLDTYENPYTGKTFPVPGRLMGPETQTFLKDGSSVAATHLPGLDIKRTHTLGPATVVANDVWLSFDSSAIVTRTTESGPEQFRVNDLETFNAHINDVLDADMPSAPARATLHLISSWAGWLGMQDQPGSQVTRLLARKAFQFEDIASQVRALLKRTHPEIAKDPISALERAPETF